MLLVGYYYWWSAYTRRKFYSARDDDLPIFESEGKIVISQESSNVTYFSGLPRGRIASSGRPPSKPKPRPT